MQKVVRQENWKRAFLFHQKIPENNPPTAAEFIPFQLVVLLSFRLSQAKVSSHFVLYFSWYIFSDCRFSSQMQKKWRNILHLTRLILRRSFILGGDEVVCACKYASSDSTLKWIFFSPLRLSTVGERGLEWLLPRLTNTCFWSNQRSFIAASWA